MSPGAPPQDRAAACWHRQPTAATRRPQQAVSSPALLAQQVAPQGSVLFAAPLHLGTRLGGPALGLRKFGIRLGLGGGTARSLVLPRLDRRLGRGQLVTRKAQLDRGEIPCAAARCL